MSDEEAKELRSLSETTYREHRTIVKDRDEEIARLKVELRELKQKADEQSRLADASRLTTANRDSQNLEPSQEALLRLMADNEARGTSTTFNDILKITERSPLKTQYDLDTLDRLDYIEDSEEDGHLLSEKGRAYLVEKLGHDLI